MFNIEGLFNLFDSSKGDIDVGKNEMRLGIDNRFRIFNLAEDVIEQIPKLESVDMTRAEAPMMPVIPELPIAAANKVIEAAAGSEEARLASIAYAKQVVSESYLPKADI